MFREITTCRICGNTDLVSVLHLGDQFLTGVFPRSSNQVISQGPLELVKCHGEPGREYCGLVQLRQSYRCEEMYGDNYGYRSSLNTSMVQHLRRKVAFLSRLAQVDRDDLILDIGSNDGTLLAGFPAEGITLVGIDPAGKKFASYYRPDIFQIPEFFTAACFRSRFGTRKARIVTSIAMFYDLEDPLSFATQVRDILAKDGIWHLEQSYLPAMLRQTAYDTVCHEHLEYYSLRQIKWIADRCSLKIIDVSMNEINGGSFAVTLAHQSSNYHADENKIHEFLTRETSQGIESLSTYERFRGAVLKSRDGLCDFLARAQNLGQLVAGYGASTKGNVILQFCRVTPKQVPCIAEVNQDKYGCLTPGTNIPICSEKEVRQLNPLYLLVLPWHFRDTLIAREKDWLQQGAKMLFPLPAMNVVGNNGQEKGHGLWERGRAA